MKEEKDNILKTNLKQLADNWVWFIVLSFIMTEQEHTSLLMKECLHRVKNILLIVRVKGA